MRDFAGLFLATSLKSSESNRFLDSQAGARQAGVLSLCLYFSNFIQNALPEVSGPSEPH